MEYSKQIVKLSNMFSVLGDPLRLSIVTFLSLGKANVSQITEKVGMSQSAVSHQLRILRDAYVLKTEKKGKQVYYSINDDHVLLIIESGLVHFNHGDNHYE